MRGATGEQAGVPESPQHLPEHGEPTLHDPGLDDLSTRDYKAIARRTLKGFMDDGVTDMAAALAYYSFLAIPAALLVVLGAATMIMSPDQITALTDRMTGIIPAEVATMLEDSLKRLKGGGAGTVFGVGLALALWTTSGAMTAFMRAFNRAYGRDETRSFIRQRLIALLMVVTVTFALVLVMGLLILGPAISSWVGEAVNAEGTVDLIWWAGQWPVLIIGLLAAFATLLYLGPNVDHPRWTFLSPGAVVAVVVWLLASGLFSVYTSMFGSYNKTWGSLSAVFVMLTWLWISSIALLLGAELNAEAERSRELRQGEPAEHELQAPEQDLLGNGDGSADGAGRGRAVRPEDLEKLSTAELVRRLSDRTRTLARQELALAQAELAQKGKKAGIGAGMLGGAGLIGVLLAGAATALAIVALALVLAAWLAALIVAVALGALAGGLALAGRGQVRRATPPPPKETVETLREDVEWVRTRIRSGARSR
ncbi:MAG: rane protein [Miltoncostaeaceae bacterium]|nr:rane protein [Miltoncostaeaceae bacterium]